VEEVVATLLEEMNKEAEEVEVFTFDTLPALSEEIFEQAKAAEKDVTFGVVNEEYEVVYQWSFAAEDISEDMSFADMDLTISFETEKAEEIKEALSTEADVFYMAINGYHGELPAPAKVTVYVGDKYEDGTVVFLYYYNEETGKVEIIDEDGTVVENGYVDYTLEHCSIYFLSDMEPEVIVPTVEPVVTPEPTAEPTVAPTATPEPTVAPTATPEPTPSFEDIDDEEVPLAVLPKDNGMLFAIAGIALGLILVVIAGYAFFGKRRMTRR